MRENREKQNKAWLDEDLFETRATSLLSGFYRLFGNKSGETSVIDEDVLMGLSPFLTPLTPGTEADEVPNKDGDEYDDRASVASSVTIATNSSEDPADPRTLLAAQLLGGGYGVDPLEGVALKTEIAKEALDPMYATRNAPEFYSGTVESFTGSDRGIKANPVISEHASASTFLGIISGVFANIAKAFTWSKASEVREQKQESATLWWNTAFGQSVATSKEAPIHVANHMHLSR